jgi:hypothetical protein
MCPVLSYMMIPKGLPLASLIRTFCGDQLPRTDEFLLQVSARFGGEDSGDDQSQESTRSFIAYSLLGSYAITFGGGSQPAVGSQLSTFSR